MNTALALVMLVTAADVVPAPDVRDNTARGLKWLADQQRADGSWDANNRVAASTLNARAGLALLMEGSTTTSGKFAAHLRKTESWFATHAQPNGRLSSNDPADTRAPILTHAHALTFLLSVYDSETNAHRAKAQASRIEKGIEFALDSRSTGGGWGQRVARDSADSDDGLSTCEMLHALLLARKSGFAVPRETVVRAVLLLEASTVSDGGLSTLTRGALVRRPTGGSSADASASAAALALTGGDLRPTALPGWVRSARRGLSNAERTLAQQNYFALQQALTFARVAYALGEGGHDRIDAADDSVQVVWSRERAKLFKEVLAKQKDDGSWPDQLGAPAYATALALIILQLDNGYLPAFTR